MNLARYYIHIFFFFSGHASTVFKEERPLGEGLPINCFFFFFVFYCNYMYLLYFLFFKTQKSKSYHTFLKIELGSNRVMGIFAHDPG